MESIEKEVALSQSETKMEDTVFLKLQEVSYEVKKKKLSNKSLYFKSLFSGNFCDSMKKEIDIECIVDLGTFKTFVEWIDDENFSANIFDHNYNRTLSKYEHSCYRELLELFRLAAFYAVDNLLNSLEYIIIDRWLHPENLIELWLIAEELNQDNFKKAIFSTCLDRFELLPHDSLFSLPKDNFEILVKNVNLRCSEAYRQSVLNEWAKRSVKNEEIKQVEENQKKDPILSLKKNQSQKPFRVIHCVTGFEKKDNAIEEATVFSWNGTQLEELAKMLNEHKNYTQAGSQILGRGYSIYVVGGETFIGHGTFNFYIMRYCLLTKKWYKVARLLEERRHMVAGFVGNKLILVGGVGKFRVKLTSVHILDIHTGVWSQGPDILQSFTDIPPSCTIGNELLVAYSGLYSFSVLTSRWSVVVPSSDTQTIKTILHHDNKLYALVQIHDEQTNIQICMIKRKEESSNDVTFVNQAKIKVGWSYHLVSMNNSFIWFIIKNGNITVQIGEIQPEGSTSMLDYMDQKNVNVCFKPNVGCFSLLNPLLLFQQSDDVTS